MNLLSGRCFRVFLFVFVNFLLQSCANQKTIVSSNETEPEIPLVFLQEFGAKPQLISEAEIFYLLPQQRAEFEKYLNNPLTAKDLRNRKVSDYLTDIMQGFNYHSDTFIASEAAQKKQGNCLSLAILTTALARVANVEVGYELVQTPPVYQKKGNTILTSQHVRSLLFQPNIPDETDFLFVFRPVLKIDYFPTGNSHLKRKVLEQEFISMYYRNKAAEAIIDQRMNDAFWLAVKSLDYAKDNAHAINMIALVYKESGHLDAAENMFLFGMEQSEEKLELLSNYQKFLVRQQRFAEAEIIQVKIDEINEPDPFDWLSLADEKLAAGELNDALRYYEKVIDLAPYLHFGYSGRGKVEFLKGNTRRAEKAFHKAEELAYSQESKSLYQAKLSALTNYQLQK